MSTAGTRTSASPRDRVRQVAVISSFVFMITGNVIGIGLLGGTPIAEAQGGSFQPDASFLTPATQAFSIWSVIYAALLGYTVWQTLPGQAVGRRQRALGWIIALSMTLNGLWLVTVQFFGLWMTVAVIIALLVCLCVLFARAVATRDRADGALDSALIDGATGLHLGWTALATVANIAAALTASAPSDWEAAADVAGVAVVVAVGLIALTLARWSRWRVTPGYAIGWGLSWLAVARLGEEPASPAIGWTAAIVAAIVVVIPTTCALRRSTVLRNRAGPAPTRPRGSAADGARGARSS